MPVSGPGSAPISILYIEDEPALLEIGKLFLEEDLLLSVVTCENVPDSIILLKERQFDAIISDYQMPGMNGIDFLKYLREKGDRTPFIILTGQSREEVVIEALNSGADFYIQKGGDPRSQFAELINKIHYAVATRRGEAEIKRRLWFERLIGLISSRFVASDDIDLPINVALEDIGSFCGASRSYIFLLREASDVMDNSHEWCADGVSPEIENLQNLPCSHFPWWMKKLRNNEIIRIRDLHEMPPEAASEKSLLEKQGVRSLIAIPLMMSDGLTGFIGFDNVERARDWNQEDINILRFCGDIIASALGRRRSEDALRKSEIFNRTLIDHIPDYIVLYGNDGRVIFANPATEQAFGYPVEELAGAHVLSFVPEEYHDLVKQKLVARAEGLPVSPYEVEIRTQEGGRITVLVQGAFMEYHDTPTNLLVLTNITDRKRSEEALRQSEEKFRSLVEYSIEAIAILDPQGRIVFANSSAAKLLDIEDHEELIGRNVLDFVAEESRDGAIRDLMAVFQGNDAYLSGYTIQSALGKKVFVECVGKQIEYDGMKADLISVRDITERKHSDEELQAADEQLQAAHLRLLAVLDGINAAVYVADIQTHELLFINKYAREITGFTGDIEGKRCWSVMKPGQEEPCGLCTNAMLMQQDGSYAGEFRWEFRNSENGRWYDSHVSVIRWIDGRYVRLKTAIDITERKMADEEALQESEKRYRSLFESMHDGYAHQELVTDPDGRPRDCRFVEVNPAFSKITGLSPEIITGKSLHDVLPEMEPVLMEYYAEAAKTGESQVFEHEEAGRDKTFEVSVYCSKDGKCTSIFHDISEKKKRDEETKRSLREKETLLKEIHHRVKNNMQVISGLLMLQRKTIDDPTIRELFRESENRVFSIALVHEKLYQSESLSRINYGQYLRTMCETIITSREIRSGTVSLLIHADGIHLSIDKAVPLSLITNELLTNSLKHGYPDGRKGTITITMERRDNEMVYRFSDDGVGFPEDLDYTQTVSLGMRLVTSLVMQLMGSISMKREEGTLFEIIFPIEPDGGVSE